MRVSLVGLLAAGHSGVPRYSAALAAALDRVCPEFPQLNLNLLTTAAGAQQVTPRTLEVVLVRRPFPDTRQGARRILTEQLAARTATGELLHFFDLSGPLLAPRRRFVTTIHDAAIRHRFERTKVAHKHLIQPWAARNATAIVAVSAFAEQEAVERFGADPPRIRVVHSGPGLVSASASRSPEPAGPYLLYVGNLEAHKNLPHLIHAFAEARTACRLLIVGGRGERVSEIQAIARASMAAEQIEFIPDASDEYLDQLYRGALALLLPSRYEGFGFTALEAMTRGCPVLASDIPALREVSADGAWLLPVSESAAWSAAIRAVVADEALRTDLRRRGEARVRRFSWDATARGVCRVWLETGATPR